MQLVIFLTKMQDIFFCFENYFFWKIQVIKVSID